MKELYEKNKLFFIILTVAGIGFLVWYFSEIVIFIIVAGVVSIIGSPLVEMLDRIKIGKFRFPHLLSVIMTLLLMIICFFGLFSIFIPLIFKEATMISAIDTQGLTEYYKNDLSRVQTTLIQYGVMPKGTTIESAVKEMIVKVIDFSLFSNILSSVISFTGAFFFNVVSIIFLSFFFLYDVKMMPRLILLLVPESQEVRTKNVMSKSKTILSRYFIGLIIQIFLNIITYSLALYIIGVRGALVIGFFAGIIIVIPYLGGLIAILTGIVLGVTGLISAGDYAAIGPMIIKIIIAMLAVQMIDNNLFQPYIQGKSVKAHPVEIFLVIIAAATLGGIPAMIVAVPGYAFLRIVATEFFSQSRLIQKMKQEEKQSKPEKIIH
jgi:predicted PurR-regulated permease PerM